ncbi:MAG: type II secretion system GspH family protein [Thiobacillus sp.]|nr:type II secretion system GspH family protein [Thiobacillus sp.]
MCIDDAQGKAGQRGLTLVELLVFIVIVGVAATAILGVFGNLTRASANLLPEKQAHAIAAGMMQEILARTPYCGTATPSDPSSSGGPEVGETRATPFNNVNDYDEFDSNLAGGIAFLDGTTLAASLPGYRVRVGVNGTATVAGVGGGNAMIVTVRATPPTGSEVRLDSVRFCYGDAP